MADGEALAELFKLAGRKIIEQALEAELSDVLGGGCYEPGAESRTRVAEWHPRPAYLPQAAHEPSGVRNRERRFGADWPHCLYFGS